MYKFNNATLEDLIKNKTVLFNFVIQTFQQIEISKL